MHLNVLIIILVVVIMSEDLNPSIKRKGNLLRKIISIQKNKGTVDAMKVKLKK